MEIIPVLDLMDGVVVHARMGQRDQYRPIETPLASSSRPADVTRGLLSIHPFTTFYIADLDAIEGRGSNNAALAQLKCAFPHLTFWVDNGIADPGRAQQWLGEDLGHLVLGSETQKDDQLVRQCRDNDRVILSLDYRGDAFVGPAAIIARADAWPNKVIVMTLARVGSAAGPDLERLTAIRSKAAHRRVYAAGGLRDAADLAALADAGIAGALVATSLHNGTLTGAQIAHL